jgi:hypothetical protein
MKDLVVARYGENINWLNSVDNYNILVYNKGEDLEIPTIKITNLGGDAQTYIHHIVTHYNDLADYTAFVQGNPFDHCEKTIEKLNAHTTEPFVWLADHVIGESINDWYSDLIQNSYPRVIGHLVTYLNETAHQILGDECPSSVVFGAGQQFIVSKELIRSRPWEFWVDIINRFPNEVILPWHIERLWGCFFHV